MSLAATDLPLLSRLFDTVAALAPPRREAWFAALPAEQRRLEAPLRRMLEQDALPDGGPDDLVLPPLPAASDPGSPQAGDRIGPYRLIRQIGQGGMGTVWLANQIDGRLTRQVALKLPRLAWDARLAERMARERDIGARLEHPNIARLYDAGVDDQGRPFLAFAYIDGLPLDAWCAAHRPSLRERLALALQLVKALTYAHGRLVVHRDLKPSNVLVDAAGQAQLLDFGIAKLLDAEPVPDAALTQLTRALTPHYAAPEQIAGEPVTVQSDIYSLGVLLYEMLAGARPIVPRRDTPGAFEDAVLSGDAVPASRRCRDPALARLLRGDLDAILAQALQRDPARRYATMAAFGDDLARHLAGARVQARAPSLGYRTTVLLRRNRLAFAAGGAVVLALLAGTGLALRQAQRAGDEAARARLVREFVTDIFTTRDAQPGGALGQLTARALLTRAAARVDEKFAGQPAIQAELHGVMRGLLFNISEAELAAEAGQRELKALQAAHASGNDVARAALQLAEVLVPLERNQGVLDAAALALAQPGLHPSLQAHAHAMRAIGWLFGWSDTHRAAQELDTAEALRADLAPLDRSALLRARGLWYAFNEDFPGARRQFEPCIDIAIAADGPHTREALHCRHELIKVLIWGGDLDAGRQQLAAALATMRATGGPDDVQAARWEAMATGWLFSGGGVSFAEAMATFDRCLAILQAQPHGQAAVFANAVRYYRAQALMRWGDFPRAAAALPPPDAPTLRGDATTRWHQLQAEAYRLMPTERAAEAPTLARQMLALDRPWKGGDDLARSYTVLAFALIHNRRYAEADAALREFDAAPLVVAGQVNPRRPPDLAEVLVALNLGRADRVLELTAGLQTKPARGATVHADESLWLARAAALCDRGRRAEGLALYDAWLPRLAADRYGANPYVAHWRAQQGLCALAAGQLPHARAAAAAADAAVQRQPGISPHLQAPVRALHAALNLH